VCCTVRIGGGRNAPHLETTVTKKTQGRGLSGMKATPAQVEELKASLSGQRGDRPPSPPVDLIASLFGEALEEAIGGNKE
jgi:hypothetical protein